MHKVLREKCIKTVANSHLYFMLFLPSFFLFPFSFSLSFLNSIYYSLINYKIPFIYFFVFLCKKGSSMRPWNLFLTAIPQTWNSDGNTADEQFHIFLNEWSCSTSIKYRVYTSESVSLSTTLLCPEDKIITYESWLHQELLEYIISLISNSLKEPLKVRILILSSELMKQDLRELN